MRINLTSGDIIWSYIGTILSMGANLIMLPFLMYYLDGDMLGLWYLFASIGAVAMLFDFGFAVTFARNITYCWSGAERLKAEDVAFVEGREPDYALMKNVLAVCRTIYGILAGGALLLLVTVGTAYIAFVSRAVPGYYHMIAWLVYALAASLNLYYGYYASFLRGVGAVKQANVNTIIARAAQIVLTVSLLWLGLGLLGAVTAYLAYGVLFRVLGKRAFYRYQGIGENLAAVEGKPDRAEMRKLLGIVWHNAWRDGAISVCNFFCNQASTVICSLYLSLAETGAYSIGVQIASALAQIAGTLYNAYQPEIQSAYINSDRDALRRVMSLVVMSFVYLFLLGVAAFSAIGLPLLRIVKPSAVLPLPVLLGLCAYQFILKFRNCYTSYFSCTNRILYLNGFLVAAVLCVALSFAAIGPLRLGLWGLIAAQIVSQAVYNLWKWPMKAHGELNFSLWEMAVMGTDECRRKLGNLFSGK